ncbi:MAG TPA: shikimate kinase [Candidatus Baltobacteraceae bacterium]|nr:shikimate kinase [Candidatus Baltobacteraceae bacterium]
MGCGKSMIGRKLARRLKCGFVDTDELIVRAHGTIPEIFANEGEGAFRTYESQAVRQALESEAESVIALGGGALTAATNRRLLERYAHRVFIKASAGQILARLRRSREVRPLLGATPTLASINELYARRMPQYLGADHVVETEGKRAGDVIEETIAWLHSRQPGSGGT